MLEMVAVPDYLMPQSEVYYRGEKRTVNDYEFGCYFGYCHQCPEPSGICPIFVRFEGYKGCVEFNQNDLKPCC